MRVVLHTLAVALAAAACHKTPAAQPTGPAPATTTATPAEPAKPTAESILEDYVTATGGRAAREAVTSMRATGTMRIAKLGVGGRLEMQMKAPNLMRLSIEIEGLGKMESGSDGKTVWEKNAMTGARVLEGNERERALRGAMLQSDLMWRELYTKVELVGEVEFEGHPAYKLEMTTPLGDVETVYFDRETKLELGKEEVSKTQMGEFPTRSVFYDYKTYGSIKMSSRMTETAQGVETELTLENVELNPTLAADAFVLPADIKPLVK
jgi:outer membrane lipoprotein-sorting protein